MLSRINSTVSGVDNNLMFYFHFQGIKRVYVTYSSGSEPPDQVTDLALKVQQLEHYLTLALETHIGNKNGRSPYYLSRLSSHLQQAEALLQSSISSGKFQVTPANSREIDHLAAEFQSTFTEYGFCEVFDAIYDVDEATQKLEALSLRLDQVERSVDNNNEDTSAALCDLHDVVAGHHGMQQAMTEANINRIKQKFNKIDERVNRVEKTISDSNISSESEFFLHYLACQHLLKSDVVRSVSAVNNDIAAADVINSHMVHPGTRGWIFERFRHWLNKTKKRLYFIGGKEGSGKTALSSAICKLYSNAAVASYFCDKKTANINSMLQSIAADLFTTMPEYLNWMDDKYSSNVGELKAKLSENSWRTTYNVLLKEPFQALYGVGSDVPGAKRRVVILDGVDQLPAAQYADFKSLLTMLMKDLPNCINVFVTVTTDEFTKLVPIDYELTEGVGLEDKSWTNRHIKVREGGGSAYHGELHTNRC